MKLTVLTENAASGRFAAEHGLSYFIEHDISLLFDSGHSDTFLRNADHLNIDLGETDTVVLSHGHWDHGNGLKYLDKKKLICHPEVFQKRYRRNSRENIGLELSRSQLAARFDIIESRKPYPVSDQIIFLGQVPRLNNFESQSTAFVNAQGEDDFVPDDSALAIIEDEKLIVVSGCAHSGICNTVEYAKKVTGIPKIDTVIGGFHLKMNDWLTQATIDYFKEQNVRHIFPSHCTELSALAAFSRAFNISQVKSGIVLKLPSS